MRVGGSTSELEAKGIRILDCTWPVVEDAALRRPSVPAEYRTLNHVSRAQACDLGVETVPSPSPL